MGKRTILVTDSGLGGLSVAADILSGLSEASAWPEVSMIYFNAWPEPDRGYNHFPDMAYRAAVFNNALEAMGRFSPDQILIACNTLSVIYPYTRFSEKTAIPVSGIVDSGVDMMDRALAADPESRVIIFGTPTTARSGIHQLALVERGIRPERIINQGCFNLAGKIERNPFGREVETMIHDYIKEAAQQFPQKGGTVFAALCCTHFGYRQDLFEQQIKEQISDQVTVLNPNKEMAGRVLAGCPGHEKPFKAQTDIRIFSRIEWEPERLAAYEKLLSPQFPQVVRALKQYHYDPHLFKESVC